MVPSIFGGSPCIERSVAMMIFEAAVFLSFITASNGQVQVEPDGRVLILSSFSSSLGTVCGDGWSDTSASVVCRNAGLSNAGTAILLRSSSIYVVRSLMHLTCKGTESDLNQCQKEAFILGVSVCNTNMDAGVDCFGGTVTSTPGGPHPGPVVTTTHLPVPMSLSVEPDGRVLIMDATSLVLGTICGDGWSDAAASVVCRTLGLSNKGTATTLTTSSMYGVWSLMGLACIGTEADYNQCQKQDFITGKSVCTTDMDAGVDCFGGMVTSPNGTVTAASRSPLNNTRKHEVFIDPSGRVLMFDIVSGMEGTVCSNAWDDRAAEVICRYLGLGGPAAAETLPRDYRYNRTAFGIHCLGNETDIMQCSVDDYDVTKGGCNNMQDAVVKCGVLPTTNTRKHEVLIDPSGRVLMFDIVRGMEGTVCSNAWDDRAAEVICRHLGLGGPAAAETLPRDYRYNRTAFGIHCLGNETDIMQCSVDDYDVTKGGCNNMQDAVVKCGVLPTTNTRKHEVFIDPSGRVLMFDIVSGMEGTVCSNAWDDRAAEVICRYLGLGGPAAAETLPRDYRYNRTAFGIHCLGNETDIMQCSVDDYDVTKGGCNNMQDAVVKCGVLPTTNTRKHEVFIDPSGRVLMFDIVSGMEGTVCSNAWDDRAAEVICRYLGLGGPAAAETLPRDYRYNRTAFGIHCLGNETDIMQCSVDDYDVTKGGCNNMQDAVVKCGVLPTTNTRKHEVFIDPSGRVLMFDIVSGMEGTVCSNAWDDRAAEVICRYLGLGGPAAAETLPRDYRYNRTAFGIHCLGNETDIMQCSVDDYDVTKGGCNNMQDAVVKCGVLPTTNTRKHEVFIDPSGRVLMFDIVRGMEGTVCSNAWNDRAAEVICRYLGLGGPAAAETLPRDYRYNRTAFGIHCLGNETDIMQCSVDDYDVTKGGCNNMQDAVVKCGVLPTTNTRKHEVFIDPSGRVLMFDIVSGMEGTVCSNAWDDRAAEVICRYLGLGGPAAAETLPRDYRYNRTAFGIHCLGNETDIMQCSVDDYDVTKGGCNNMQDAVVKCGVLPTTNTRKHEVLIDPSGRVLMFDIVRGMEGTVCSNAWDDRAAEVICRHLGLGGPAAAETLPRDYRYNRTAFGIHCLGNETDIMQCSVDDYDVTKGGCNNMQDAVVKCGVLPTTNTRKHEVFIDPSGRVLMFDIVSGMEGTVCSNAWDDRAAEVICRYLGLGGPAAAETLPRDYRYNRTAFGIHCLGNETDIMQCSVDDYDVTKGGCNNMQDAVVKCGVLPTTNTRKHEVFIDPSGRVLMFDIVRGMEGTVCSNAWDDRAAEVICRYLGLGGPAAAETLPRDYRYNRTAFGIHCLGNETDIMQCSVDDYDVTKGGCNNMQDAVVKCGVLPTTNTRKHEVLIDPSGRVLMFDKVRGMEGTVCSNAWDDRAAEVICRHLGLGGPAAAETLPRDYRYNRTAFGIHCLGNETDIMQCSVDDYDVTKGGCNNMQDAVVKCGVLPTTNTRKHEVLIDPSGRVLMFDKVRGMEGTVCSNAWDDRAAEVICRHLGLGGPAAAETLPRDYRYNRTAFGIHCLGNETDIMQCSVDDYDVTKGGCNNMQDAVVKCGVLPTTNTRKHEVLIDPSGRVLMFDIVRGMEGTVCSNAWDDRAAEVICRHLGLGGPAAAETLPRDYRYNRTAFGIHCLGNETDIMQCSVDDYDVTKGGCNNMQDAVVKCGVLPTTNTRKHEVFIDPSGRVLMFDIVRGMEGTVCSNAWDDRAAEVICRYLGLGGPAAAETLPRDYRYNRTAFGIHCLGNETDIMQCSVDDYDVTKGGCNNMQDAVVKCGVLPTTNTRKHEVLIDPSGRVLMFDKVRGMEGTVCSNAWDDRAAEVICRHLGLGGPAAAETLPRDYRYNRTAFGIHCLGNETDIMQCSVDDYDVTKGGCNNMQDAVVKCGVLPTTNTRKHEVFIDPSGRVLMFDIVRGMEGTVCSNAWDDRAAEVICRYLGLGGPAAAETLPRDYRYNRTAFGIHCLGNETDIMQCSVDDYDVTKGGCNNMQDAVVKCGVLPTTNNRTHEVFIDPSGRVLMFDIVRGMEGTVCSNAWDDRAAEVICRYLGLGGPAAAETLPRDYRYNRTAFGIHCLGNETDIMQCSVDDYDVTKGGCNNMQDAVVKCGVLPTTNTRKHEVFIDPSGRVLMFDIVSGMEGTVCSNAWDDRAAEVICRYLGLGGPAAAETLPRDYRYNRTAFGIHCLGNETDIMQCSVDDYDVTKGGCNNMQDAVVKCGVLPTTNNRTHEVFIDPSGRVLMFDIVRGMDGTVCSNAWDDRAAEVICRYLGLGGPAAAETLPRDYRYNRTAFGIHCLGNETDVMQCSVDDYDVTKGGCNNMQDAVVKCGVLPTTNTRKHEVFIDPSGRVLMFDMVRGMEGTVCSNAWDDRAAEVICRYLGLGGPAAAETLPRDYRYNRTAFGIHCLGNETDIMQCSVDDYDVTKGGCNNMQDAVVKCGVLPTTNTRKHEVFIDPSGRVLMFDIVRGMEGTVCSNAWDDRAAEVICRYLGLGGPAAAETLPRDYRYNRTAFGIHCLGNETDIMQCSVDDYDVTKGGCNNMQDAVVKCGVLPTTNTRKHEVFIDPSGRVLMFDIVRGMEGTVCSNAWDDRAAEVICRYLGLGGPAAAETLPRDYRYNRTAFGIHCLGNETDIMQCSVDDYDITKGGCNNMQDAVVKCGVLPTTNTRKHEVFIDPSGRVLMFDIVRGMEGTVCSNAWDDRAAEVICRYLGLGGPAAAETLPRDYRYNRTAFGIHCLGNETDIMQCSVDDYDVTKGGCNNMQDAVVKCGVLPTTNTRKHEVFIDPSGRVLMFDIVRGMEGTVCSNAWDDRAAEVICRYLGLGGPAAAETLPRDYRYNRTAFGIHCLGNETDIMQCSVDDYDVTKGGCNNMQDAVVKCGVLPTTNTRKHEVFIDPSGRVLMFDIVRGMEGTVCSNAWDDRAAEVICRYLGLGGPAAAETLPRDYRYNRTAFGIHCLGNETDIMQCSVDDYDVTKGGCNNMQDAVVKCGVLPTTNTRKHEVFIDPSGRVLMFDIVRGMEGTVCSNAWDDRAAEVICRYLGLGGPAAAETLPRDYRYNRTAFGIHCLGNETDIMQCSVDDYDVTKGGCNNMQDAVVKCGVLPTTNTRKHEVFIDPSGRVLMFDIVRGMEGTVCSNAWDDRAAEVICRYLGLGGPAAAETLPRDYRYNRTAFGIHCLGNETDIMQCSVDDYDVTKGGCNKMQDAVVKCGVLPTTNNRTHEVFLDPSGRVLMFDIVRGMEGTVCSNDWDDRDAEVICRYLGLGGPAAAETLPRDYRYNRTAFGIHCLGNETDVMQCSVDDYDVTKGGCNNMQDAVVKCGVLPTTNNRTHEVFIDPSGRVLMFDIVRGMEGTVCSNSWDDRAAEVICRYLGLGGPAAAETLPRDLRYNRTAFGIYCLGNETDIMQCSVDDYDVTKGGCNNMQDAVVKCGVLPTTSTATSPPNGMTSSQSMGTHGHVTSLPTNNSTASTSPHLHGMTSTPTSGSRGTSSSPQSFLSSQSVSAGGTTPLPTPSPSMGTPGTTPPPPGMTSSPSSGTRGTTASPPGMTSSPSSGTPGTTASPPGKTSSPSSGSQGTTLPPHSMSSSKSVSTGGTTPLPNGMTSSPSSGTSGSTASPPGMTSSPSSGSQGTTLPPHSMSSSKSVSTGGTTPLPNGMTSSPSSGTSGSTASPPRMTSSTSSGSRGTTLPPHSMSSSKSVSTGGTTPLPNGITASQSSGTPGTTAPPPGKTSSPSSGSQGTTLPPHIMSSSKSVSIGGTTPLPNRMTTSPSSGTSGSTASPPGMTSSPSSSSRGTTLPPHIMSSSKSVSIGGTTPLPNGITASQSSGTSGSTASPPGMTSSPSSGSRGTTLPPHSMSSSQSVSTGGTTPLPNGITASQSSGTSGSTASPPGMTSSPSIGSRGTTLPPHSMSSSKSVSTGGTTSLPNGITASQSSGTPGTTAPPPGKTSSPSSGSQGTTLPPHIMSSSKSVSIGGTTPLPNRMTTSPSSGTSGSTASPPGMTSSPSSSSRGTTLPPHIMSSSKSVSIGGTTPLPNGITASQSSGTSGSTASPPGMTSSPSSGSRGTTLPPHSMSSSQSVSTGGTTPLPNGITASQSSGTSGFTASPPGITSSPSIGSRGTTLPPHSMSSSKSVSTGGTTSLPNGITASQSSGTPGTTAPPPGKTSSPSSGSQGTTLPPHIMSSSKSVSIGGTTPLPNRMTSSPSNGTSGSTASPPGMTSSPSSGSRGTTLPPHSMSSSQSVSTGGTTPLPNGITASQSSGTSGSTASPPGMTSSPSSASRGTTLPPHSMSSSKSVSTGGTTPLPNGITASQSSGTPGTTAPPPGKTSSPSSGSQGTTLPPHIMSSSKSVSTGGTTSLPNGMTSSPSSGTSGSTASPPGKTSSPSNSSRGTTLPRHSMSSSKSVSTGGTTSLPNGMTSSPSSGTSGSTASPPGMTSSPSSGSRGTTLPPHSMSSSKSVSTGGTTSLPNGIMSSPSSGTPGTTASPPGMTSSPSSGSRGTTLPPHSMSSSKSVSTGGTTPLPNGITASQSSGTPGTTAPPPGKTSSPSSGSQGTTLPPHSMSSSKSVSTGGTTSLPNGMTSSPSSGTSGSTASPPGMTSSPSSNSRGTTLPRHSMSSSKSVSTGGTTSLPNGMTSSPSSGTSGSTASPPGMTSSPSSNSRGTTLPRHSMSSSKSVSTGGTTSLPNGITASQSSGTPGTTAPPPGKTSSPSSGSQGTTLPPHIMSSSKSVSIGGTTPLPNRMTSSPSNGTSGSTASPPGMTSSPSSGSRGTTLPPHSMSSSQSVSTGGTTTLPNGITASQSSGTSGSTASPPGMTSSPSSASRGTTLPPHSMSSSKSVSTGGTTPLPNGITASQSSGTPGTTAPPPGKTSSPSSGSQGTTLPPHIMSSSKSVSTGGTTSLPNGMTSSPSSGTSGSTASPPGKTSSPSNSSRVTTLPRHSMSSSKSVSTGGTTSLPNGMTSSPSSGTSGSTASPPGMTSSPSSGSRGTTLPPHSVSSSKSVSTGGTTSLPNGIMSSPSSGTPGTTASPPGMTSSPSSGSRGTTLPPHSMSSSKSVSTGGTTPLPNGITASQSSGTPGTTAPPPGKTSSPSSGSQGTTLPPHSMSSSKSVSTGGTTSLPNGMTSSPSSGTSGSTASPPGMTSSPSSNSRGTTLPRHSMSSSKSVSTGGTTSLPNGMTSSPSSGTSGSTASPPGMTSSPSSNSRGTTLPRHSMSSSKSVSTGGTTSLPNGITASQSSGTPGTTAPPPGKTSSPSSGSQGTTLPPHIMSSSKSVSIGGTTPLPNRMTSSPSNGTSGSTASPPGMTSSPSSGSRGTTLPPHSMSSSQSVSTGGTTTLPNGITASQSSGTSGSTASPPGMTSSPSSASRGTTLPPHSMSSSKSVSTGGTTPLPNGITASQSSGTPGTTAPPPGKTSSPSSGSQGTTLPPHIMSSSKSVSTGGTTSLPNGMTSSPSSGTSGSTASPPGKTSSPSNSSRVTTLPRHSMSSSKSVSTGGTTSLPNGMTSSPSSGTSGSTASPPGMTSSPSSGSRGTTLPPHSMSSSKSVSTGGTTSLPNGMMSSPSSGTPGTTASPPGMTSSPSSGSRGTTLPPHSMSSSKSVSTGGTTPLPNGITASQSSGTPGTTAPPPGKTSSPSSGSQGTTLLRHSMSSSKSVSTGGTTSLPNGMTSSPSSGTSGSTASPPGMTSSPSSGSRGTTLPPHSMSSSKSVSTGGTTPLPNGITASQSIRTPGTTAPPPGKTSSPSSGSQGTTLPPHIMSSSKSVSIGGTTPLPNRMTSSPSSGTSGSTASPPGMTSSPTSGSQGTTLPPHSMSSSKSVITGGTTSLPNRMTSSPSSGTSGSTASPPGMTSSPTSGSQGTTLPPHIMSSSKSVSTGGTTPLSNGMSSSPSIQPTFTTSPPPGMTSSPSSSSVMTSSISSPRAIITHSTRMTPSVSTSRPQSGMNSSMYFSLSTDSRVMVHDMSGGHVGSICSFLWDDTEAAVMCQHLGLLGPGVATVLQRDQNYSRGLFAINCTGNERDAFDCDLATSDISNGLCGHLGDAALYCGTRDNMTSTSGVTASSSPIVSQTTSSTVMPVVTSSQHTSPLASTSLSSTTRQATTASPSTSRQASTASPSTSRQPSTASPSTTRQATTASPSTTGQANTASPSTSRQATTASPSTTRQATAASPSTSRQATTASPSTSRQATTASPSTSRQATTASPSTSRQATTASPSTSRQATTASPSTSRQATTASPSTSRQATTASPSTTRQALTASPSISRQATTASPSTSRQATTASPSTSRQATTASPSTSRQPSTASPSTTRQATTASPSTSRQPSTASPSTTRQATTASPSTSRQATTASLSTSRQATTVSPSTSRQPSTASPSTSRQPSTASPSTSRQPSTASPSTTRQSSTASPSTSRQATTASPSTTRQALTASPSISRQATTASPSTSRQATTASPSTSRQATTASPSTSRQPSTASPSTTRQATTASPSTSRQPSTASPSTTRQATTASPSTSRQATTASLSTSRQATTVSPSTSRQPSTASPSTSRQPSTASPSTSRQPSTASPSTTRQSSTASPSTSRQATTASPSTSRQATTASPSTSRQPSTASPSTTRQATTASPSTSGQATTASPSTSRQPSTASPSTTRQAATVSTTTTQQATSNSTAAAVSTSTPQPQTTTETQTSTTTGTNCVSGSGFCSFNADSLGSGATSWHAGLASTILSVLLVMVSLVLNI